MRDSEIHDFPFSISFSIQSNQIGTVAKIEALDTCIGKRFVDDTGKIETGPVTYN